MKARTGGKWMLAMVMAAGLAVGLAAPVMAQEGQKPGGGDGVLGGPRVEDGGRRGQNQRFTERRADGRPAEPPMRMVVRAIESLKGGETPEAQRLTAEQEAQVRAIGEEYRAAMREYVTAHRDELMKLRDQVPPPERRRVNEALGQLRQQGQPGQGQPGQGQPGQGQPGGRGAEGRGGEGRGPEAAPGAGGGERPRRGRPGGAGGEGGMGDEMAPPPDRRPDLPPEQVEAARARLREIMEGAPKQSDATTKMMNVLTAEQRELATKAMERMRVEAERRMRERGEGGGGMGGPGGAAMDRLPPEMRERFRNASPEEREAMLRELRERRRGGEGAPPRQPE